MVNLKCDACKKEYPEDKFPQPRDFTFDSLIIDDKYGLYINTFYCETCYNSILEDILGN